MGERMGSRRRATDSDEFMSSKKRFGAWKWLVCVVLVAAAVGAWKYYSAQAKDQAPDFKTTAVTRGDLTQVVTANGQLSAVKNVTVGSQVSGIITELYVDFNARVTNGQLIAEIDPSTYLQTITQNEAELANSKAGLELAQLNMRRAKELRAAELISAAEYDKTEVELHQAEAVVKTRNATLEKTKVDLARCKIYAPIDGVVISRAVDKGQTVAASFNAPVLFNIANDLHFMRIEAMVSEADVGGVEEGQRVNFTVDAFPGRIFHGEVTQVRFAPVTNQNVVNYTSVVEVNNDDLKLRPGMTANASIITAQRRDALRVPNAALRFRPPENSIVKSTNSPAGGHGTNQVMARAGGEGGPNGSGGDGERPNREEMRRRFESMTPEQREEFRSRMRARFGGEGGSGGGGGRLSGEGGSGRGGGGSGRGESSPVRTVYILEKEALANKEEAVLRPVTVKVGIADAASTEILEGLKEGDQIVTGVNLPVGSPAAMAATPGRGPGGPFGGPFGGGGGFRGR